MALSFFKKNKDKPASPERQTTPVTEGPSTQSLMTVNMGASGIMVEEVSGAPQSPVDEAAILYASGQTDMTEHMLQGILGDLCVNLSPPSIKALCSEN